MAFAVITDSSENKMQINFQKTKEIVFRRPNPKLIIYPPPLDQIDQVPFAKLLGVTLDQALRFDMHIKNTLKLCSQRFYLLKLLRDQGLPSHHLNTVFHALIISLLQYALPAWSGFLSAELSGRVNSVLKRAFNYGFTTVKRSTFFGDSPTGQTP